ncbi:MULTISPECIES: aminotransferase class V-fold PLP-dependent enzyme [unclassified Legionella]|uniref:aminotransferase class V-fold PLP-dependent enzyme n=1 Tax=unclassified Legionella TaxID=2622702 RepID=UPI003AF434E1
MSDLAINQVRADTPGCQLVLHFNNAGAALPPNAVVTAMKEHLDLEATTGGYEAAALHLSQSEKMYVNAARLIHCKPEEIAFVDNATRAWEMAFYSFQFKKGDRILTACCEYASNYLAFLHRAKRVGVDIEVIANDQYGQLDLGDLQKKIDKRIKLIAITHVPTQGGLINPIIEVGKIAKQEGIPYLVDTTQSIGQMPINVEAIGCDFLCATGRKYLRGPRGTGFLYARNSVLSQYEPPFIDLHAARWISDNDYQLRTDARRFETWEQNIAAKIGLGVAIEYALELGIDVIWQRIQYLATRLRQQLATLPSVALHDLGQHQCGIVTFTCKGITPAVIQQELSKQKINVSISLQEYARLDLAPRNLPALVRASVHYYNNEEEIDQFCNALQALIQTR